MPRIVAIVSIVAGAIMIIVGVAVYFIVQEELSDEKITVSDDADNFAGEPVDGPFTAYAEAEVIQKHSLEAGGGKTYAELDRDDPTRDTVMNASFLRASLFTSVVAFGVATLVAGLGVLFILFGLGFLGILKRLDERVPAVVTPVEPAPESAPAPAPAT
jgi:amino acid permease